jgi:endonuclease III
MTRARKSVRFSTTPPKYVIEVAARLKKSYLDFDHYNLKDPLDELLFIICSTKTEEASYRNTFRALMESFPTHNAIAAADAGDIARAIVRGGLSKQKAKAIRNLLDAVVARFGEPGLEPLCSMGDEEAEEFLVSLPGVGKKIARCVMLYSLGRTVFPVDTHCWRISKRLGWIRPTQKDKNCAPRDMDRLQSKIPADLRYSLHVNMISLGRKICLARNPKCEICPIAKYCRYIGVNRIGS